MASAKISSRANYTAQACDDCRRRKLKCDGNEPCNRCSQRATSCRYSQLNRPKAHLHDKDVSRLRTEIASMREQIDALTSIVTNAKENVTAPSTYPASGPSPCSERVPLLRENEVGDQQPSTPKSQTFRGPTSTEYSLKIARGSLHDSQSPDGSAEISSDITTGLSSETLADRRPSIMLVLSDPLWAWGAVEVRRLVDVFMRGPGSIYPIVEPHKLFHTYENLLMLLDAAKEAMHQDKKPFDPENLASTEAITLKLVLAIASAVESCGISDQVRRIFDSIRIWLGRAFWGLPGLPKVVNWLLVAQLHLYIDEELQASRVVAVAARLCLEMGINRKEVMHRASEEHSASALANNIVWSTFILDRKMSIALGLPFVIQDCDMDFTTSSQGHGTTYLAALVSLSRISGAANRLASRLSDKNQELQLDEIDYLEYQIHHWERNLPEALKLARADMDSWRDASQPNHPVLCQKFALKLHANQLLDLVHRPILFTRNRVATNVSRASAAVDVARETLQLLFEFNLQTRLLQAYPFSFKQFLLSAFSVLVLAITNFNPRDRPDTEMSSKLALIAQQEFHQALDLFKSLGSRSMTLRRLWESVKFLEGLLPRADPSLAHTVSTSYEPRRIAEKSVLEEDFGSTMRLAPAETRLDDFELALSATSSMNMPLTNEFSNLLGPSMNDMFPNLNGFSGLLEASAFDGSVIN